MKPKKTKPNQRLFPRLFLLLVFIVGKSNGACITGYREVPFTTYFVIIGTYQEELNAIKHVRQARFFIESTDYFFNTIKNSYYVFAFKSDDKHTTLNKLHELRVDPYFREAWYYKHQFDRFPGSQPPMVKNERKTIQNPHLKLQKKRPAVKVEDPAPAIDHASLLPIIGQIAEEQDNPGNSFTDSGQDTVTSVNKTLTHQNPIEQMEKAETGDIIIFNNLLFHRNAAILQQSSESDLNKLLSIMRDNSHIKIRIHGHTNGDFRGEIITMGKKNKNYFQTNSKNDYVNGDAVLLSVERAKIISRYLNEKGILPDRIEIKGWGGEKTLYPLNSAKSSLNSRVEIEILEK